MYSDIKILEVENHKRILGILFLVTASFEALILLLLNAFLTTLFGFLITQADADETAVMELVSELFRYLIPFILLFSSVPSIIAGFGMLYKKSWALTLALILGCFKLFSFPVGTCLGVYTIWVYSEDQKIQKAALRPG